MNKNEYIQGLLKNRRFGPEIMGAALLFWHAEVPYSEAQKYMDIYQSKIPVVR